jgi:hypothetical protein
MAMNKASKFATKIDERFHSKLLTEIAVNKDYDWSGVSTVSVYGIDTVAMSTYTRSGTSRYGTVTELGNTKQDLTLARDRSFTFSIDQGNFTETQMVMRAGEALARELDEVCMPEIDVYRLAAWGTVAGTTGKNAVVAAAATTATNAYSNFLALNSSLSDDLVPTTGRIAFLTNQYYAFLKQSNFVVAAGSAYSDRKSGSLGQVDGVEIVIVPSSYMPTATDLILVHPSATVSPRKIEDFKTHDNPPGINGKLVEGRLIYDTFVLNNKNKAVATHKVA